MRCAVRGRGQKGIQNVYCVPFVCRGKMSIAKKLDFYRCDLDQYGSSCIFVTSGNREHQNIAHPLSWISDNLIARFASGCYERLGWTARETERMKKIDLRFVIP